MIIELFAIYDTKAMVYSQIMPFQNESVAARAAQNLMDEQNSAIATNPMDYALFSIGFYDDETAELNAIPTPRKILAFHELQPRQMSLDPQQNNFDLDAHEAVADTNIGQSDYAEKMAEAHNPDPQLKEA